MEASSERRKSAGEATRRDRRGGGPRPGKRRLFMAGRVDGDVQQVRIAPCVRAPIRGPWSLALVVKPG